MDVLSWFERVSPTAIFMTTFLALATAVWLRSFKSSYPPGPRPLPILGSLLRLACQKDPARFLTSLGEKYGPVCLVWIGSQATVLLNSWDAIKEAYISKAEQFSQRPFLYTNRIHLKGERAGIVLTNGSTHQALRRLTLMALHDFGLGKQDLEDKIREESMVLLARLEATNGKPISDMKRAIQLSVVNVIANVCFGKRMSHDDKDFTTIMSMLDSVFSRPVTLVPQNFFPLTRLLPLSSTVKASSLLSGKLNEYISRQIESHRDSFDVNHLRDFIDIYLKAEVDGDRHLTTQNLFRVILDLFVGGTETTATTLMWTVLYLIKYPSVQKTAHNEIDKVLGRDIAAAGKDRKRLVYVEAVLHEVWRMASILFLSLPRYISEKGVTVGGYELPPNSLVIPTMFNVHMNKDYWHDPEAFRPERWIDGSGALVNHDYYMPFSIGKRSCLGETFARLEAFIMLTTLLQRFTFSAPDGFSMPSDDDSIIGVTRSPLPFSVCVTLRN